MGKNKGKTKLSLFDVTNLVVGAIVGADIYVASTFGAGLLGPLSLVVWVVAGFIAMIIALAFGQCAALLPKTGGPYAYARDAWGSFAGFTVGWSLWLAEWISLAAFPVAFTQYLSFFVPNLTLTEQIAVKSAFVIFLATTNIVGVKSAGRTNDVLTIVKLAPLFLFAFAGILYVAQNVPQAMTNLTPFTPYGYANFGTALVLIFWAYAGFEISTIPAGEVEEPRKTIPRAIVAGMIIVSVFYLTTNFALFGVRSWTVLKTDTAPLASGMTDALGVGSTLALVGGMFVGIGALVSVAGSDESGMIGTTSLSYALASDGLFPHSFARLSKRYKTPYIAILVQSVTALVAAIFGTLSLLVATSVFFLSVAYLATSLSIYPLRRKYPDRKRHLRGGAVIPLLSAILSLVLISQCSVTQIELGVGLLLVGIPIYVFYSPRKELTEVKNALLNRRSVLETARRVEHRFLAHLLLHLKQLYRRITRKR